jgi:Phytanoyl-CoA dioxygenase (PhyH)
MVMIDKAQRDTFLQQGYLVVPDVIPQVLCDRVIEAILDYTGVALGDERSWYKGNYAGHGIIPMHHHQALWDIRQHPSVHRVFSAICGTEKLWVSMDRASYKPPAAPATREWKQSPVHWDCDPWHPGETGVQGLVYLSDTSKQQGAFSCVPSIFQNLSAYLDDHADDKNRRHPRVTESDLLNVEGSAGSLVVFNRLMPHTSGLNFTDRHRFVQYVTMQPVTDEKTREQRVVEWREKMPPIWAINQKIVNQEIPEPGETAKLTDLGRKLVGLENWT